ncbi:MAG: hypothetical protein ACP5SB_06180 [Caldisericaceae bacterium]
MVFFFYPSRRTLTLSLTGTYCALHCDHCNAQYLKGMSDKNTVLRILREHPHKYESILVSGGSTEEGKVPILEHLDFIKEVHSMGLKLNFHTGLLNEKEIRAIEPYAERVSFDFVYSDHVVKDIYHLSENKKEDFEKTYLLMRRILGGHIENDLGYPSSRVVPHLTIGLDCGKVSTDDFDAIDELAVIKPTLLIIDVFIPTKGTPFESCPEPSAEDALRVIEKAKRKLTKTTLFLGCMRPFGAFRNIVDVKSYEIGVKGFVMPSRVLIDKVRQAGEEVVTREECCALV